MNFPEDLNEAGEIAWREAEQAIAEQSAPEGRFELAVRRYALAAHVAHALHAEWEEMGSPMLEWGGATGKVKVTHPLIKSISDANRDTSRFAADLGLTPQSRKKLGAVRGRPQERVPAKRKDSEPPKVVPIRKAG